MEAGIESVLSAGRFSMRTPLDQLVDSSPRRAFGTSQSRLYRRRLSPEILMKLSRQSARLRSRWIAAVEAQPESRANLKLAPDVTPRGPATGHAETRSGACSPRAPTVTSTTVSPVPALCRGTAAGLVVVNSGSPDARTPVSVKRRWRVSSHGVEITSARAAAAAAVAGLALAACAPTQPTPTL